MFLLVNTGLFVFVIATIVISYAVCQNSLAGAQAWFPELFQAKTRSSGASLAYQISAMVSGFTPFITTLLLSRFGWMGPALLFSLYAAIGLWAALAPGKPGASASASLQIRPPKAPPTGERLMTATEGARMTATTGTP